MHSTDSPPPVPEPLKKQARERLGMPVSEQAREELKRFWNLFQAVESETKKVIENPSYHPKTSCEGGFILRDLNRATSGTEIGVWLGKLGNPGSSITEEWLEENGHSLEGDGILLPDGNILNWTPYSLLDPRWAWAALGYVLLVVDPSLRPKFGTTPAHLEIPSDIPITLVLAGDWGTGDWDDAGHRSPAALIGRQMKNVIPDISVHLGDVYPLGLEHIEHANLAGEWPAGKYGSFALNSNHEMYAAGRGYYLTALGHPIFEGQQRTGYFSIDYGNWLVLGLDTAWYDESLIFMSGGLSANDDEHQNRFLVEAGQRAREQDKSILLLTHYPGLSLDGLARTGLADRIRYLLGQWPDVWYWGHNHKGIVYSEQSALPSSVRARCIGHGALPFGEASGLTLEDGTLKKEIDYLTRTPLGYQEGAENNRHSTAGSPESRDRALTERATSNRVRNGFAVLTLGPGGMHEKFVDQFGETEWEGSVGTDPLRSGPPGKVRRAALVLAVLLVAFSFLDWGRLVWESFQKPGIGLFRALIKLSTVFVSAGLAWTVGSRALSPPDRKRIGLSFAFIAVADTLFVAGQYARDFTGDHTLRLGFLAVGVVLFGAAHATFFVRHMSGWLDALRAGVLKPRTIKLAALVPVLLVGAAFVSITLVPSGWFGRIVNAYLVVLTASMFAAVQTRWTGQFDSVNARLISWGVLAFVLTDISVIFSMTHDVIAASSLTWLFYVPALFLLALSGYRNIAR